MKDDRIREECGVFGLFSNSEKSVSEDIYYGLIALQHRGQESAGISVTDREGNMGNSITHKGMGLVSEVFDAELLGRLKGNIGLGHVRYSTTGESVISNAQPIAMNYIKGSLALAHNGNIINAAELKKAQMLRGLAHFGTTDSEVIAYEIIFDRVNTGSIEEAVKKTAGKIRGGYALLVMSPRKLVAIRDPLGIKPLVLGKRGDDFILASESAAITSIGGKLIRDVRPGEIICISSDGIKSDLSLCGENHAHCIFEYIYFARCDSVMDGVEVHEARVRAGRALARSAPVDADLVAGVPDSGIAAAEGYSMESGIRFGHIFHKNSYIGRSFIKPTDRERKIAVHMKLNVLRDAVNNKRIVLIDDSIVRGNTMRQIIEALKNAGAREVHVRISSPPFLHPCFYGTDVPGSGELIASDHSGKEVCEAIGADSLCHLHLEDFKTVVPGHRFCCACFDGNYPVK
ncbi:MAG: amidophosphoribosyltransferase [Lachnospiraceae bacterium]|nr:amidophosphoribosyltransferase [Lachnospiraceae bacterium]